MGEERAARESIASNDPAIAVLSLDNHPRVAVRIDCLRSSVGDKFIYVHNDASGYIALRFDHTFEEALMIKHEGKNGEMLIAA